MPSDDSTLAQKIEGVVETIREQESSVLVGTIAYIRTLLSSPLDKVKKMLEYSDLSTYVLAARLCKVKGVPKDTIVANTMGVQNFMDDYFEASEEERDEIEIGDYLTKSN